MKEVIKKRQFDLTVILENVHDPHNIGAVLRTCDSIGINEVFILYTQPDLQERGISIGLKSSSGAKQWIKINYFEDIHTCFTAVRERYPKIYGTAIGASAKSLYDLDLASSCALLFGNEHEGVSEEALNLIDQNFLIPQFGFVQSLNISVACAVSLYEASRQRMATGQYNRDFGDHEMDAPTYERFLDIHRQKKYNKINNKQI